MKRVFYVLPRRYPQLYGHLADAGPLADRVLVDLRPRHQLLDAIYKAVNRHISEHGTDVECVVLDVRSYLSVKYPTDAERFLPDDQVACGSTKILCGHMTSDEPTIIIVSAAGENDSIRLLACQPATPGSTTYTADSRKEPTT